MLNENNNNTHDDINAESQTEKEENARTTRRHIEDYLEQKALEKRLKDVFDEDFLLEE